MLVGTLARLSTVLRKLIGEENVVEDEKNEPNVASIEIVVKAENFEIDADLGEVVSREEVAVGKVRRENIEDNNKDKDVRIAFQEPSGKEKRDHITKEDTRMLQKPRSTRKPKKRRKKGDAFDALFDSLL